MKPRKYIVFDLDETIGHFYKMSSLYNTIWDYSDKQINLQLLLELYPEVFRPGIMKIFEYLKQKKIKDKSIKVVIFTNNMGPKSWTNAIKRFIEKKINYKLFDHVITGWKINGKINEPLRTSYMKLLRDFKRATGCKNKDKILFLDDQYHEDMNKKMVTYLHLKPYKKNISNKILLNRFLRSSNNKIVKLNNWEDFISLYNEHYGDDDDDSEQSYHTNNGTMLSGQIFPAVRNFIEPSIKKTIKKKSKGHKKTRRL